MVKKQDLLQKYLNVKRPKSTNYLYQALRIKMKSFR